jgi:hypothetical protein
MGHFSALSRETSPLYVDGAAHIPLVEAEEVRRCELSLVGRVH